MSDKKMERIDVNTTSDNPTYFLRGVELVRQANDFYNMPSENWPYPTKHRFGMPQDLYYAEVWNDGMDWNSNYWLIEAVSYNDPKIYPLVFFEDSNDRDKYNDYDFSLLMRAIMFYRRDHLWIRQDERGVYNDQVWSYIQPAQEKMERCPCMRKFTASHGSLGPVDFYMNEECVPEYVLTK